ncbi:MAG: hypothetical protein AB7O68_21265 [Pirellulales bacterium]
MNASALVAALLAVGQTAATPGDARPPAAPRSSTAPAATASSPAAATDSRGERRSRQLALDAVQLLADSLAPKSDDELTGDPISLTQALGSALDPNNRPAVIHAYWQLVAATADYHNRRTEAHFLAQLQAERGDHAPPSAAAAGENSGQGIAPSEPADWHFGTDAPQPDDSIYDDAEAAPLQEGPPAVETPAVETDDAGAAPGGESPFSAPAGEPALGDRHQRQYRAAPANAAIDDPDRAQLAAALSASRARIQESLVAAVEAQHRLSALIRGGRPSLASDAPHVGPYRTEFRTVFAGRAAPGEAWRLDRTLPLRQRELLTRTAAVIASEDALDARLDAYRRGECPLAEVLDSLELIVGQRQQFVAAVQRYNDDIGDYATLIAPAGTNEVSLAALLIKPRTSPIAPNGGRSRPAPSGADSEVAVPEARRGSLAGDGVGAASFTEPASGGASPARPRRNPNSAVPAAGVEPSASGPAVAAPAAEPSRAPGWSGGNSRRRGAATAPQGAAPPAAAPATDSPGMPSDDELQFDGPPDVSIEPAPPSETQPNNSHSTYRAETSSAAASGQVAPDAAIAAALSETRLYGDLSQEPPHRQAQQLIARLGVPAAESSAGGADGASFAPLSIEQCLDAASLARAGSNPSLTERRRAAVVAYWNCRQQASRIGVCQEHASLLSALESLVIARRAAPAGAADALSWRAHSLSAQAACEQATTDLVVAEWQLNVMLSQPLDRPWYTAHTAPHAGRYRTKLDQLAPTLAESTVIRQRAAMIGQSYGAVTSRATEVVEVDRWRSDVLARYAAGRGSLTDVLSSLERQSTDSLAFLADLTRYNQAIADYALSVVPTDLPVATLAGALVMKSNPSDG